MIAGLVECPSVSLNPWISTEGVAQMKPWRKWFKWGMILILAFPWLCWISTACLALVGGLLSERLEELLLGGTLTGVWYVNYKDEGLCDVEKASRLSEVLILGRGNYWQLFWDGVEGKVVEERRGLWWSDSLPNGVVRVHLEGGRFYAQENCAIEEGSKEVVLELRGSFLVYPPVEAPDGTRMVRLRRLSPR